MKTFSITDLMRKTSNVFNEVQKNGLAKIKGKGRPEFVIVEKGYFDSIKSDLESANSALDKLSDIKCGG